MGTLQHLLDVGFKVRAEYGTVKMTLDEILQLQSRGLVELDRASDGYVDLYIDEQKIARGEVIAVGNRFAVRISELIEVKRVRPKPVIGPPPFIMRDGSFKMEDFIRSAELLDDIDADLRDGAIADPYEFPSFDGLAPDSRRRDEQSTGPVDVDSETYSPRRSLPQHRQGA